MLIISLSLSISFFVQPKSAQAACATPVFINEFHYDNVGTDVDEFIEIAGPAGLALAGWSLVLYNGADNRPYGSPIQLYGLFPDEVDGMGALAFAAPGIQNGSPDGIALVDDTGAVRHLVSYEGSFVAISGPATGMTLSDIGVAEGANTPIGYSLQLTGSGECMGEFIWSSPAPASPGRLNQGQSFSSVPHVVSVEPADGRYDVARDAPLSVTFSRAVTVVGPVFIDCTKSGVQSVAPILHSANSLTIPHNNFSAGESCTVTIPATSVLNTAETPSPMTADFAWQFAIAYTPTAAATLFISHEELHSRTVVDAQDDPWRAAAQETLMCPNFLTAALQEAQNVQCGDRVGDCILPSTLGSGLVISYTLRNMDGRPLGSADAWASGHGDGCNGGATLQDGAPRPNGIPGCYYNDAGNLRGNNSNANGVLFTFSEPVAAFGAWFGDLETKPYGTTYYRDGAGGGSGSGGALAYLRLFFEDGAMQEAAIEPTLAPGAPWLSAAAPPPALPLTAGGHVGFCGGPNAATDADGCGNSSTRWVGFVSDDPQRRVTQMLVAVGDDDHSGAGPSDGPNVVCEGGDGGTCNGGTEYLSFIGPTVCVAPDLAIAKQVEPEIVRPGDIVTYTLLYNNFVSGFTTGPITITDPLPSGLELVEVIAAEPPALLVAQTPQWRVSSLPAGVTGQITFRARVVEGAAGPITNTVTIDTAGDNNLTNNHATAAIFVAAPTVDLRLTVNGHEAPHPPGPEVDAGAVITVTYTILNSGNVGLTQLLLADDQNPGLTCLEGALPDLLTPGAAFICTVTGTVEIGQVAHQAMVTATPMVGPSAPVSAIGAGHYIGIGYGAIEVRLQAEPRLAQWFTFTTTGGTHFVLMDAQESDHANSIVLPDLRAGQPYTVAVEPVAGWLLYSLSCSDETENDILYGDASVTMTPAAGETVSCVFTHRAIAPTLTVVTTVVNDDGGEATAAEFPLFVSGQPLADGEPITLQSGPYQVTTSGPAGYVAHFGGDCTAQGLVTLAPGMDAHCTILLDDQFASLGDRVWLDEESNGLQDAHETGVNAVVLYLYNDAGEIMAQTTSDADGFYHFARLLPGAYAVGFVLPAGYTFAHPNATDDDATDSDVDVLTGRTSLIVLGASEHRTTVDAGLVWLAPIDDTPVNNDPVTIGGDSDNNTPMDEEVIDDGSIDDEPVDVAPVDDEPSDSGLVDPGQVDDDSIDEEPPGDETAIDQPTPEEPTDEEPIDEEPVDEEPAVEEPIDEEPIAEEPAVDEGTGSSPHLVFSKRAEQSSVWLSTNTMQVLTYTLYFANEGTIIARNVAIIERAPQSTAFYAAASSPGWQCNQDGAAGHPCHYAIGNLPAHTEGRVVFAVQVVDPAALTGNVIINVAELHADDAVPEQAARPLVLEASANVEVFRPTALNESSEPGQRAQRLFLPLVTR